jgi:hypothetical protein
VLRHLNKDAPEWFPTLVPTATLLSSSAPVWVPVTVRAASVDAATTAQGAATSASVATATASAVATVTLLRAATLLEFRQTRTVAPLPPPPAPTAHPCRPSCPRQILGSNHLEWSAGIAFGSPLPGSDEEAIDDDSVKHRDPREDGLDETEPKCSEQHGKSTSSFAGSECKVPPTGRPPDRIRRPP